MKIRKIKWKNHEVLGDLELDFTKADGTAYNNIILVGENGSGKTTVLTTVSSFLNIGSFDCFEYLEYEVNGNKYRALHREEGQSHQGFFVIQNLQSGEKRQVNSYKNFKEETIWQDEADPRNNGCVMTKARSDYKTEPITHTSTMGLDVDMHDSDDKDSFTSLKQLMVDVEEQDNQLFRELNRGKKQDEVVTDNAFMQHHSKMQRFSKAFDDFFSDSHMRFQKVVNHGNKKEICFEKYSKQIPIDSLSTGEKQVVFRGAYLLKNLNKLAGGTVFIDEPELSMHPLWQGKILNYYQSLFSDVNGLQNSQIFFATHSNHVLESALAKPDDNLIIMMVNQNGVISHKKVDTTERVLPNITSAEVNYIAFNIVSRDYHNELYGYLQYKAGPNASGNALTVKECDGYIKNSAKYVSTKHYKYSSFIDKNGRPHEYETLPTYLRNIIDHPSPTAPSPSLEQLNTSILLLRELLI